MPTTRFYFNRCMAILATLPVVAITSTAHAGPVALHKLGAKVKVSVSVVTSFREVDVTIENKSSAARTISINGSHWFKSPDSKVQDLAVVFPVQVTVGAKKTRVVRVKTACRQADRASPSTGLAMKLGKTRSLHLKFGGLIAGYHHALLHQMIATATGSEHHDTTDKKQHFLQLMTWIYFRSTQKHMVQFAQKHIFKGDQKRSKAFVEKLHPLAKKAIDLYKAAPIPVPALP